MPEEISAFDCPCGRRLYGSTATVLVKAYVDHTRRIHHQFMTFEAAHYAVRLKGFIVDDDDDGMEMSGFG